jgi:hypothetical protein
MLSVLSLLVLSTTGMETIGGPSDEELYVAEIRDLIVAANLQLVEASDGLAQCLGGFSECISDPAPVVQQLEAARIGLADLRTNVSRLTVPDRYRSINELVAQALTDSIDGIALHMVGLQEASLEKFEAGSDLTALGREQLMEAVALLEVTPPRSPWADLLLVLLIAVPVALVSSLALLLWRYRRRRRGRSPPRDDEGS